MEKKPYRIGIDLGGTNIKVGILDAEHNIVYKKSGDTGAHRPWQEVAQDMAGLVTQTLTAAGIAVETCEKIGIGSPGMVDHLGGVVRFAGNLNWVDVPLVAEMRRYFSMPVRLSNDANCAVLGEAVAGAAKGAGHVVLVTLGTGIGGGVVAGGILQEGGSAGGMELGHTLLVMDGEACTCGRRGCVEAYASASALVRHARQAAQADPSSLMHRLCRGNLDNMSGKIPFEGARAGDAAAQRVVDDYVHYLGETLIDFINIWRPEKLLLGGGVSHEGAPLLEPLNAYVRHRTFAGDKGYVPTVEQAALGNDAGIVGAAALV